MWWGQEWEVGWRQCGVDLLENLNSLKWNHASFLCGCVQHSPKALAFSFHTKFSTEFLKIVHKSWIFSQLAVRPLYTTDWWEDSHLNLLGESFPVGHHWSGRRVAVGAVEVQVSSMVKSIRVAEQICFLFLSESCRTSNRIFLIIPCSLYSHTTCNIQHEKTLVTFTNGEIGFFVTKSSSGGCKSDISHPFLSPLCAPPPNKSLKQWRVAVKE